MNQIKKVLNFELGNYFRNKSYFITTVVFTVILVIVLCIPTIMNVISGDDSSDSKGNQEITNPEDLDTLVLYDGVGVIKDLGYLQNQYGNYNWKLLSSEDDVKSQITNDKAVGGFVIKSPIDFTYVVNNSGMYDSKQDMFTEIMRYYYRAKYMEEKGIEVASMEKVISTEITSAQEILGKDSVGNYAYTYILVMVTYFIILLYGQLIATSVTAEKSNRAIEVLVTSAKPTSLIFGKVFAGVIASFLQVGVILIAGVVTYKFNRDSWGGLLDPVFNIPVEVLITFFLFLVIGFLFYSFLYASLGALVSKTEDISKSIGPITFVFMIGFFIAIVGMNDPDGMLVKVSSYIPFTSVYCMVIRVAMGTVGIVEIIISLLILAATSVAAGVLGAKIYRMGTLHYGNPLKLSAVIKKIVKGKE